MTHDEDVRRRLIHGVEIARSHVRVEGRGPSRAVVSALTALARGPFYYLRRPLAGGLAGPGRTLAGGLAGLGRTLAGDLAGLGRTLAGLALVTLAASGCAAPALAHRAIYVAVAPPPDLNEIEGGAPAPGYVWTGGHYEWNGFEYVWLSGRWEQRPTARAVFIHGRWRHTRYGWIYVEGYWT